MWALIIQSCNQSSGGNVYIYEKENFKSYGVIVASLLDCIGSVLKSLMSFVTLHQAQSQSNNATAATVTETSEGAAAAAPTHDRDDAQSFLEAVYRSQLINGLVEAFRWVWPWYRHEVLLLLSS